VEELMTSVIAEWPASSPQLDELFAAHAKALAELKNAPRTSKSHFGMYADLATLIDTVRFPLSNHGLAFTQAFCVYDENYDVLISTLSHSSGQFIRSFNRIRVNLPPQQYAATATYMKRVALSAIVGVAAEDEDDGETATRAAVVSHVEDESRIEKIGMAKLREAKSDEERADILAKAEKRVQEGTLSREALVRLAAAAVDAAVAKPKPATTSKPQAARTPAAAAT
jgi:hypothetical protein